MSSIWLSALVMLAASSGGCSPSDGSDNPSAFGGSTSHPAAGGRTGVAGSGGQLTGGTGGSGSIGAGGFVSGGGSSGGGTAGHSFGSAGAAGHAGHPVGNAGHAGQSSGGAGGASATWTEIYTKYLSNEQYASNCNGSSCHNPGKQRGVDFSTKANGYDSAKALPMTIVSLLSTGSMPRQKPKMPAADLELIKAWFAAGMPDN